MRDKRLIKIKRRLERAHTLCKRHNTSCVIVYDGEILAELFPYPEPIRAISKRIAAQSHVDPDRIGVQYFSGTPILKIGNNLWRPDGCRFVCNDPFVAPRMLIISMLTERTQYPNPPKFFGKNFLGIAKNFRRLNFLDGFDNEARARFGMLAGKLTLWLAAHGYLSYTVQRTFWVRDQFREYIASIGGNVSELELKIGGKR